MQNTAAQDEKTRHAIEMLLDSLVEQQRYLPSSARPICSPEDLPRSLKAHAQSTEPFASWRAWADEGRLRFIVARLTEQSRIRTGLTCLEVNFFDPDGVMVAAGEWALKENGSWMLIRVLEVPPDTSAQPNRPSQNRARADL